VLLSLLAVLVVLAPMFLMASAQSVRSQPSVEAFFDPFDAVSSKRWYISEGWSNGSWQNCTWSRRAITLEDSTLRLLFLPAAKGSSEPQLCGEVQTKPRFLHGTFEARIKTDRASGVNAAFFTYIGPVHEKPHDEIDVEILTRDTGQVFFNTYRSGQAGKSVTSPLPVPADSAFQTYSFIWEPDRIRWFVDGILMHESTTDVPVTPQKIYLSHWGSDTLTDWMGPFTPPDRPLVMEVDWVAYTPLGALCQFPESVLCQVQ